MFRPDKYAAMSVDARQELDLKIGVAFSRLMTKAYLDMAKEKFRLVAEHRNISGIERAIHGKEFFAATSINTRQELDLKIGVVSTSG